MDIFRAERDGVVLDVSAVDEDMRDVPRLYVQLQKGSRSIGVAVDVHEARELRMQLLGWEMHRLKAELERGRLPSWVGGPSK